MRTALALLATGKEYWRYVFPLLESAQKFFPPHEPFLWTDSEDDFPTTKIYLAPQGYPNTTLLRYHTFLREEKRLGKFDYIFYADIDAYFENPVEPDEIFAEGISATLHPGHLGTCGDPERRMKSVARIAKPGPRHYFAGGFVGGTAERFLDMARVIASEIDVDHSRSVVAKWHDESHLNRFLENHPPAKILGPEFCYPAVGGAEEYFLRDTCARAKYIPGLPKLRLINKTFCRTCNRPSIVDQNYCEEHLIADRALQRRGL